MIVLRCGSGLAFALFLASCAGQVDTSKYALAERDASAPPVRFSRADINPDGTLVDPYPVRAPRGSIKKYASKERDRSQSDARQDGNGATSDIGRHAIKTGLNSRQSDDPTTAGTLAGRSQAQFAQDTSCKYLKNPEHRLKCYDKADAPPAQTKPDKAELQNIVDQAKEDERMKKLLRPICKNC